MNLIKPAIFDTSKNVIAVFTEANRIKDTGINSVDGLKFGINTEEKTKKIKKNYQRLLEIIGFQSVSIALANQVHGSKIQLVNQPGLYQDVDGLITKKKKLPIGIQVADCAAVLLADDKEEIVGAFHAGWRGAISGIIPKGIGRMNELGGDCLNYKAYVSPCISKKMFEVGEEVAIQFPEKFVDWNHYSKPHVDLKEFLKHQLMTSGVLESNIEVSEECTMQNSRFFSYRRERDRAGRMLGLISLKE